MGRYLRPVRIAGRTLILAVSNHHQWYPARAMLLDPETGAVVEEYWHPGRIYFVVIRDLDQDGAPELVFAAINNPGNGLGHAALGVLALPFSQTPRREFAAGDPLAPLTGGGERAYRLFPLPEVNRAMGALPIPSRLVIDGLDRIQIMLSYPENGAVAYSFDLSLKLLEHRVSDNYAALHHRLVQHKLISEPLTPETYARLGRVMALEAAPDGNSPAVNRFWEE